MAGAEAIWASLSLRKRLLRAIEGEAGRQRVHAAVLDIKPQAGEGIRIAFRDNQKQVSTLWDSYAEFPSARLVTTLLMRTLPR
jgi:hypothetical protein